MVADAALESRVLSVEAAAAATGCSAREALGLMNELNTSVQAFGTLPLGLVARDREEIPDAGESRSYTFSMRDRRGDDRPQRVRARRGGALSRDGPGTTGVRPAPCTRRGEHPDPSARPADLDVDTEY